jgi:hypothetical protein
MPTHPLVQLSGSSSWLQRYREFCRRMSHRLQETSSIGSRSAMSPNVTAPLLLMAAER